MILTGKRHDFEIGYDVGFDDDGRIEGVAFDLASRCGYSTDLSLAINDRAMFHADNAYFLNNATIVSHRYRTNTVSNTAFRGFGGPQGMMGIERVMDVIARRAGQRPARRAQGEPLRRGPAQHHALSSDGRGQHRARHHRGAGGEVALSRAPRRRRQIQCGQRRAQARPGADAGQVRHLLHHHPSQPGRRAGACLCRRQRASEPRRHRDGAGPDDQGRPGRRRGIPASTSTA